MKMKKLSYSVILFKKNHVWKIYSFVKEGEVYKFNVLNLKLNLITSLKLAFPGAKAN